MTTTPKLGYAYLDMDKRMNFKPAEYIDTENPGFWQTNRAYIAMVWKIDTSDIRGMHYLFTQLRDSYKLNPERIMEFAKSIDFDMQLLHKYKNENPIQ